MTPPELADLHAKAFDDARAWTTAEFAALLSQPGTLIQTLPGCFALIRIVADEAELLTLATDPAYRRQGQARAVLQAAHTKAMQAGAVSIFLEVAADNEAAKRLYEALGYEQVGRRAHYYQRNDGSAVDAMVMRCALKMA